MEMLRAYFLISTLLTFICLMKVPPSKMTPFNNFMGSLIASVAWGWVVWPLALAAAVKSRRAQQSVTR